MLKRTLCILGYSETPREFAETLPPAHPSAASLALCPSIAAPAFWGLAVPASSGLTARALAPGDDGRCPAGISWSQIAAPQAAQATFSAGSASSVSEKPLHGGDRSAPACTRRSSSQRREEGRGEPRQARQCSSRNCPAAFEQRRSNVVGGSYLRCLVGASRRQRGRARRQHRRKRARIRSTAQGYGGRG